MRFAIIIVFLLSIERISFAQQVIQEPVVGVTSVNTTVSVPDRGRMFMGGVSSAQSGRSQYGPLRTGPSNGLTRQSTSISVGVYIHDLQTMDEEILNSAPSTSDTRRSETGSGPSKTAGEIRPEPVASLVEKAIKYEQLARKAEEAGKAGVAKLHWQMAAKYGSKAGKERIAETSQLSSVRAQPTASR